MLQEVNLGARSLADYTHIVGRPLVEEIRALSEPLQGKRVLHLSATAFGGGVSEILYTLVPLMRDVGIDAHWQVILGREEFFNVTKLMHNSLQGAPEALSDAQKETYDRYNHLNAMGMEGDWDAVVVHDPQPAVMRSYAPENAKKWIWRCHIDVSTPNADTLELILPHISEYDASFWHQPGYVPAQMNGAPNVRHRAAGDRSALTEEHGLQSRGRRLRLPAVRDRPRAPPDAARSPASTPGRTRWGVIDAYRAVAAEIPEVQLALVGSMATDDPEGWEFFNNTVQYAAGDPDIQILNNLNNVGAIEVNAFQSQADVCLQKSIREGFGLTVSEALWKARPTIGGDVGGIPLQITDGETGFLVSSSEECAQRTLEILQDSDLGQRLGRTGKEQVRERFLTPRLLRDYAQLFCDLLDES